MWRWKQCETMWYNVILILFLEHCRGSGGAPCSTLSTVIELSSGCDEMLVKWFHSYVSLCCPWFSVWSHSLSLLAKLSQIVFSTQLAAKGKMVILWTSLYVSEIPTIKLFSTHCMCPGLVKKWGKYLWIKPSVNIFVSI